ncbi:D-alanyl-D-alanine carboxypeptidase/D-alanyl-D-alanine-endopeptidase [Luteolibacter sp. Populi]|uniref:D-alanyl-D-alanine carboxypeptidase/D-alanyl-D-alanine endopeptidase n=1 Tax=Luteolibacter sp. Populi TaxID=3230487 RepID=UPI003466F77A
MQASSIFKGALFLSGWAVAGWLMFMKPLEPLKIGAVGKSSGPVGKAFDQWAATPALKGSLLAFCVLDERGEPIFASPLAGTALCPASAFKTVTTAAALELLGPDYRFETILNATAPSGDGGLLHGNLILVGSGDPTLSSGDIEELAAQAVKSGLKQIDGMVLVDASAFPPRPANDHWNWGDIGNAYGAGAFGINVDHNRMMIRCEPGGREGDGVKIAGTTPPVEGIQWLNYLGTGVAGSGDRAVIYSEPYGKTVTLHGTVPAGEAGFEVSAAIPDPPALAQQLLKTALEKAGVKVLGQSVNQQGDFIPLATHRSAPLPEIIDHLHFVSDNLEAQCLFLTMGRVRQGDPAAVLKEFWESKGVAFSGLRLIDGSGLARATMIRPIDLAKINHIARKGPQGERFRQSLKPYLDGKVRAKLGAMSGVKTEVGFLILLDGRELTYALVANGLDPELDYWPVRQQLLETAREGL